MDFSKQQFPLQMTKGRRFKDAAYNYTASMFGVTSDDSRTPKEACENLFIKLYQTRDALTKLSADMLTPKAIELSDQINSFVPRPSRED